MRILRWSGKTRKDRRNKDFGDTRGVAPTEDNERKSLKMVLAINIGN